MPTRVAALDLGSNSFHLALFTRQGSACIQTERHKLAVGLGRSVFGAGAIDDAHYAAGLAAVRSLAAKLVGTGVEAVLAVATSALREADNGLAFLADAERIAGFPIRIIDGHEEARLVGLSASAAAPARRALTFDLGGGSLELAITDRQRCVHAQSLAIGTLRSRAEWPEGRVSVHALSALRTGVRCALEAPLARVASEGYDCASLSCGAARDLLRLARAWLPAAHSGRHLDRELLGELAVRLLTLSDAGAQERARVSVTREVESLLVAALVFDLLLVGLVLPAIEVSRANVRHGLALDYLAGRERTVAPRRAYASPTSVVTFPVP